MNKVTVWPLELVWIADEKEEDTKICEIIGPKTTVGTKIHTIDSLGQHRKFE